MRMAQPAGRLVLPKLSKPRFCRAAKSFTHSIRGSLDIFVRTTIKSIEDIMSQVARAPAQGATCQRASTSAHSSFDPRPREGSDNGEGELGRPNPGLRGPKFKVGHCALTGAFRYRTDREQIPPILPRLSLRVYVLFFRILPRRFWLPSTKSFANK
jgi:hypothetical protein